MEMAVVDAVAYSLAIPLWQLFGGHGDAIIADVTARPRS
jgi:L-alanine-DL-glutamate epimerase-like enolase superfamily enzyme